jgi:hypothetical protein
MVGKNCKPWRQFLNLSGGKYANLSVPDSDAAAYTPRENGMLNSVTPLDANAEE